jgi:hypothetical protein
MRNNRSSSQVQRIADELIAPNAAAVDVSGEFPWANVAAINALALNTIFIPEQFGGMPMSYKLYLEIVSMISEACASTGIIYATSYHGIKPLIDFGTTSSARGCCRGSWPAASARWLSPKPLPVRTPPECGRYSPRTADDILDQRVEVFHLERRRRGSLPAVWQVV